MTDTPATSLAQAIERGLCIGPMAGVEKQLRIEIKRFISDKMFKVYTTASPETREVLQDLFNQLTDSKSSEIRFK